MDAFNYDVIYHAGSLNCTADCLSRLPLPGTSATDSDTKPELVALLSRSLMSVTQKEFESVSMACSELSALHTQISKDWPTVLQNET